MDTHADHDGAQSLRRRIADGFEKLALALKTHVWHGASAAGLSATQAQILALLGQRGAQEGLRLSEIAEELAITPATASDALRALQVKGLVVKGRAQRDARALAVRLTDAGAELSHKMQSLSDFMLNAIDELSPAEQSSMHLAMVKIIVRLQDDGRIPLARMCFNCGYLRPGAHEDAEHPHRCSFTDRAIGNGDVRFDCPHHVRADAATIKERRRNLKLDQR
jgi:DNA-binding MarR family transcriptional regulator